MTDPYANPEDYVLASTHQAIVGRLSKALDVLRWREGEDCWCSLKNVDYPDWHTPDCKAVRLTLGVEEVAAGTAPAEDAPAPSPAFTPDPTFPFHVEGCICPRFRDIAPNLLADLTCPIHGVEGTDPGDKLTD